MISRTRFKKARTPLGIAPGAGRLGLGLFCGLLMYATAVPKATAEATAKATATALVAGKKGRGAALEKNQPALHFLRFGKGPAVVFLHGLGGDSSVWIDEMQRLEATHTVLLIDLPGHGQSKAAAPHIELPAIAHQITELMAAQKLGPAVVVGHSLGGTLAGYVALDDKATVRGVVAVDSMFAPYPIPQEDLDKLRFQLGRDPARALRGLFAPMAKDPRQLDKIVAGAWRVTPQTLVGYLDFASERDDLRRRAGEIHVPVHVMATPLLTENQSDPARVQLLLGQVGYSGIANLSYDYFPHARHWIFWDDPVGFHDSLEKFLRRVEGPPVATSAISRPAGAAKLTKKARPLARAPR